MELILYQLRHLHREQKIVPDHRASMTINELCPIPNAINARKANAKTTAMHNENAIPKTQKVHGFFA